MKEVEILVEVFDNKNKTLEKLKQFKSRGVNDILDIYYFDPLRGGLKPDTTGKLSACFRLRQKNNKTYLTYKKDYFEKEGSWLYSDEHEVEVSDIRTAENIIEHLGFKTLVEIRNKKHTYETDDYEIVLEEVEGLGLFLEVEKKLVGKQENIAEIKKEIWKFIKSLNIKVGKELNAGKPELVLSRRK